MLFISLRHVPRKGMAGSYAKFMFYCLRHCGTICQSGCIVLYSHQYCECIPVSPHLLYLIKSLFITIIPKSLYWYLTVIFNLHFPKQGCQASFPSVGGTAKGSYPAAMPWGESRTQCLELFLSITLALLKLL